MIGRRLGGWCWIVVGLLLVADVITALGWVGFAASDRFAPGRITISDLGATGCAVPDVQYQNCSPLHPVLDLALIAVGLMIIAGALLVTVAGWPGWSGPAARTLLVITGLLVALQGVLPQWNAYGPEPAALASGTTVGAIALMLLGLAGGPDIPARRVLLVLGLVGLSCGLTFLGLAVADPPQLLSRFGGVLERLAVYPVLAGLVLLGVHRLRGKSLASAAAAA